MAWWVLLLLPCVGVVVGFMNVMAGGGSALSMPILIVLGLEPATANGTNRVAILVQNGAAVESFRRRGYFEPRRSLGLAVCTLPGAIIGAMAAVVVDPLLFRRLLAAVLVMAVVMMARPPNRSARSRQRPVLAHIAAVGVGFWGGFMQAGVGFLLMPLLERLMAFDLVRVNMHKVFIVGCFTIPALAVFVAEGHVWWLGGAALAVGNAVGARLGARVTVEGGERVIRWVFVAAALVLAVRMAIAG
jgi:uncharacterized membrane protein YfcA